MLENFVAAFTPAGATTWNGIATSCNFATVYWLRCANGHVPAGALAFAGVDINGALRTIALAGTRIYPPNLLAGHPHVQPGTVITFMTPNLQSVGHSCVVTAGLTVGGYNQVGWFTTPAANHNFSTHNLGTDLMWVARPLAIMSTRRVRTAGNHEYYLYATSDVTALPLAP
jgi:hypothetical protein